MLLALHKSVSIGIASTPFLLVRVSTITPLLDQAGHTSGFDWVSVKCVEEGKPFTSFIHWPSHAT